MKIALVNKHGALGGIETVVQQLHRGLPSRGFECDFWFAENPAGNAPSSVRPFYPRLLDRLSRTRFSRQVETLFPRFRWTNRVFDSLRGRDYDVIHVHGFDETYATLESLRELAAAKPVALTLHSTWLFTGGCGQPAGCERYTGACGECPQAGEWPIPPSDNTAEQLEHKRQVLDHAPIHFIAPSLHLRAKALRSAPGRGWSIAHLPNGVDSEFFHGQGKQEEALRRACGMDPGRIIVLAMCRDFRDPVKGPAIMEEALRSLERDDVQVVLVGAYGEAFAEKLPARLKPLALGYVNDIQLRRRLYTAADVFLFSSIAETFPCVILEAMSSECCVVSTPLEAVREQLDDGETGFVASDFSGPALGRELARACADRERLPEVGRKARASVESRFSEKTMLDRHEEFYRGLLS